MMPSTALAIGCSPGRTPDGAVQGTCWTVFHRLATAGAMAFLMLLAACDGALSHRSLAEISGKLPIGNDVRKVRVEVENGSVGIDVHEESVVKFGGGVRRAADTAAELAVLDAVPAELTAAVDPADPTTMVVRGPVLAAAGAKGVLAYELGLHLPAGLELEVLVGNNGKVTVANRRAALKVTTGRGDLRFENCHGGIKAQTGRGMVIAFGVVGRIDIEAGIGDMQAFVPGPDDLIRLRTGQGTIQCYVPEATGFVCSARTEAGFVGSSFGLPIESTTGYGKAMTGQHGDGRTKIVLSTGSGYLSLQKHQP
jgi:hypothetical protein